MVRTLWLTNDLPPGRGGIERFVGELVARSCPGGTLVLGPAHDDGAAWDASQRVPIRRWRGPVLPTPAVARWVKDNARSHRADVLVLGASWPLGELAGGLRSELGIPVFGLSHGLEAGLVQAGFGGLVARATRGIDVLTTISDWTETRLRRHVRAGRVERLAPGVAVDRYVPDREAGQRWRADNGIPPDALVVGCVSRLVRRKGQDRLLGVWTRVLRRHPSAWLLIVGDGPLERRLRQHPIVRDPGGQVLLVGALDGDDLPSCYAALDVFAMPCRTRMGGLDVEGLGIVYLEAQATGLPVVAGRSGGAPEAVLEGTSGIVVDGRDDDELVAALDTWLADAGARTRAGEAGRRWVRTNFDWEAIGARFTALLAETVAAGP